MAERQSIKITAELESYWANLRCQYSEPPASHLFVSVTSPQSYLGPLLSKALEIYLVLKARSNDELFRRTSTRSIKYTIDLLGDRCIDAYSSSDAAKLRDHLFDRGLSSSSVKRVF